MMSLEDLAVNYQFNPDVSSKLAMHVIALYFYGHHNFWRWLVHVVIMDPDPADDFLLDLPEDEDQEDAGIDIVHNKKYYTLWKKKDIVQEAYAVPHQVRLTAQKYGVQRNQICTWRNKANALSALPLYPSPCTVKEQAVIKKENKNSCGTKVNHH
jgi:hypothetical protein